MGHHIVAQAAFVLVGAAEVDVVEVAAQVVELFGANARRATVLFEETEFVLRFGERDPETTPGRELALRSPEFGHFAAGVTADERIVVYL